MKGGRVVPWPLIITMIHRLLKWADDHDPVEWCYERAFNWLEKRGYIYGDTPNKCHSCRFYLRGGKCWYVGYFISTFDEPGLDDWAPDRADSMRADALMCGPDAQWYKEKR